MAREVRRLGAIFLAAACLLGALCAWKARATGPSGPWPWQAWPALAFAGAGLVCLALGERARPILRGWTALGVMLGRLVSPVVLSILYFAVLTPFALGARLFRRGNIPMRPDTRAATYWEKPREPKSSRARMLRQY